ncbi:MAG: right-handed parallel beta-helix repeat-containing protein [Oscillospiraceae bacterium]|nr:right-handed parallel beta-helix repeat-containing protein [Oscillospiraceae bacterium]
MLIAAGLMLAMISCSGSRNSEKSGTSSEEAEFDPVNPVIYLESGAENGNGTEKSPYGEVSKAVAKAKELGRAGAKHITLKFGSGNYFLTRKIELIGWEFGWASLEMVCEDEEKAIIGAWVPVTNFTETEVNGVKAWVADMPQINGKTVYAHQFFNSDYERLERPRYPEEGFLYVSELVTSDGRIVPTSECTDRKSKDFDRNSFVFGEGDIIEGISRVSDVQLFLVHYWNTQRRTLEAIDYDNNILKICGAGGDNFIDSGLPARYYLDNVFEALDSPGEIYDDSETGKLYYIPRENDNITDFTVFASTIEQIMLIEGMNGSESQQSLVMKNIGFVGSDWKRINKEANQAETMLSAAVQVSDSSYISIENCAFDHIGNYAVELKTHVNNIVFDHCSFSDLGAGGVRISGANIVPVTEEVPHDITITDCTINGYGKIFGAAVGMLIQNAHDCQILHNEISDGYYTGISIGWVWGYGDNATSNILVEKNHIYNIGKGVLSDMGGIYTLGKQPGTVLRGNLIHDVFSYEKGYGGWAYYTDEGSSDILIEKNIGYNTSDVVFHQHYGENNIVRNNIFAFGKFGGVKGSRTEDHLSFTFERNIVVNDFGPIYRCDPEIKESWVDDSNLLWDYTLQEDIVSMTQPFKDLTRQEVDSFNKENKEAMIACGFYKNAVFADPLFADPFNYDFTLAENSPAFDIGFEPIDVSDIGPRALTAKQN